MPAVPRVVLLSLGVLLEDIVVVVAAVVLGAAGVILEVVSGTAAINGVGSLFWPQPSQNTRWPVVS
jgi:hypothetical protein